MRLEGKINLVIHGLIALGTNGAVVVAIWGNWFRSKFRPPKLILTAHTLEGDPARFGSGTRVMFYHLRVINQQAWLPAPNCRVMLTGLSRRDPSDIFQPVALSVPQQFVWGPAEFTPPSVTLLKEHVLDFGYIRRKWHPIVPRLHGIPFNFQGFVGANEAVRFQLQIEAANFSSPIYVVEVAWDGVWDFVPAAMRHHIPIRFIPYLGTR